jgi:hypothetical protein
MLKIRKLLEQATELNLIHEIQFVILRRVTVSFFKAFGDELSQLKNEDVRLALCLICYGINKKMVELMKSSEKPNRSGKRTIFARPIEQT